MIVWQEFELAYFEAAVHHFNHYTTGTLKSEFKSFYFYVNPFQIWFYFTILRQLKLKFRFENKLVLDSFITCKFPVV